MTAIPKERGSLKVAATKITENGLLKILGNYMNSEVGIKKGFARNKVYSNYEKE